MISLRVGDSDLLIGYHLNLESWAQYEIDLTMQIEVEKEDGIVGLNKPF